MGAHQEHSVLRDGECWGREGALGEHLQEWSMYRYNQAVGLLHNNEKNDWALGSVKLSRALGSFNVQEGGGVLVKLAIKMHSSIARSATHSLFWLFPLGSHTNRNGWQRNKSSTTNMCTHVGSPNIQEKTKPREDDSGVS